MDSNSSARSLTAFIFRVEITASRPSSLIITLEPPPKTKKLFIRVHLRSSASNFFNSFIAKTRLSSFSGSRKSFALPPTCMVVCFERFSLSFTPPVKYSLSLKKCAIWSIVFIRNIIERKQRFIHRVLNSSQSLREHRDISDTRNTILVQHTLCELRALCEKF